MKWKLRVIFNRISLYTNDVIIKAIMIIIKKIAKHPGIKIRLFSEMVHYMLSIDNNHKVMGIFRVEKSKNTYQSGDNIFSAVDLSISILIPLDIDKVECHAEIIQENLWNLHEQSMLSHLDRDKKNEICRYCKECNTKYNIFKDAPYPFICRSCNKTLILKSEI